MKVLIVNTKEKSGGAAKAACSLYAGFQDRDVSASYYVMRQESDHEDVIPYSRKKQVNKLLTSLDKLPLKLFARGRTKGPFSLNWFPSSAVNRINAFDSDIVNLHWINQGFIDIASLPAISKPVVWTLHDSWAFTGGCHIPFTCQKYVEQCGNCPQLKSGYDYDLSRWTYRRKEKAYALMPDLTFVTPSNWLASCLKNSGLCGSRRVEVINNGIDHHLFKPADKNTARDEFRLSRDRKVILFGAMDALTDKNKGYYFLREALNEFTALDRNAELVVFGAERPDGFADFGLKTSYVGKITDEKRIATLYSAADVMVVPSMQENLPFTVMESLACGTPVVAFRVGGIPDMVDHCVNGYLAEPFDPVDLARGIAFVTGSDNHRYSKLSSNARIKVETHFTLEKQLSSYAALYREILKQN